MSHKIDPAKAAMMSGAVTYIAGLDRSSSRPSSHPSPAEMAQKSEARTTFLSDDKRIRELLKAMGAPATEEGIEELKRGFRDGQSKVQQDETFLQRKFTERGLVPSRKDYQKDAAIKAVKDLAKFVTDESLEHTCGSCGKTSVAIIARCTRCKEAFYCNRACQNAHWPKHKLVCVVKGSDGPGAGPSTAGPAEGPSTKPKTKKI